MWKNSSERDGRKTSECYISGIWICDPCHHMVGDIIFLSAHKYFVVKKIRRVSWVRNATRNSTPTFLRLSTSSPRARTLA